MLEPYLRDVEFPATKIELIDAASDAGAPQDAVERLQQLDQEQYETRDELEAELGPDGLAAT
jgi:hypothetical protein